MRVFAGAWVSSLEPKARRPSSCGGRDLHRRAEDKVLLEIKPPQPHGHHVDRGMLGFLGAGLSYWPNLLSKVISSFRVMLLNTGPFVHKLRWVGCMGDPATPTPLAVGTAVS